MAVVAAAFLLVPGRIGNRYLTLSLHDNKRDVLAFEELGRLEFAKWDPVSHISIVDMPPSGKLAADRGKKHVAYDGGTQSSNFYPFDGNFQALRQDLPRQLMAQFWQRGVLAAHYLRRDTGNSRHHRKRGRARDQGGAHVRRLGYRRGRDGRHRRPAGDRPLRRLHRSHLRAAGRPRARRRRAQLSARVIEEYDIIQVFSNYTSSSAASGSGVLNPVYLQTSRATSSTSRTCRAMASFKSTITLTRG